jgi:pseudaminic acid cytidylyltransferase
MKNSTVSFAIIPARGGSQRIKKKNIKKFYYKPILYWTIKALKQSKLFSKIILTTDDTKIAKIASQLGVDYIVIRPANLADNYTPAKPVIEHAIRVLNKKFKINYVCCVYPCNPFLNSLDLKKSFQILKKNKKNFVFPITEYAHPIQRAFKLGKKNKLIFFKKKNELTRTQDLVKSYHDAGQFYWGSISNWLSKKKIHSNGIGMQTPKWRSVDIDNLEDWKKAELLFKILKVNGKN